MAMKERLMWLAVIIALNACGFSHEKKEIGDWQEKISIPALRIRISEKKEGKRIKNERNEYIWMIIDK